MNTETIEIIDKIDNDYRSLNNNNNFKKQSGKNNGNHYHNNGNNHSENGFKIYVNDEFKCDFCGSKLKYDNSSTPVDSVFAEVIFKCKRRKIYRNDNKYKLQISELVVVEIEGGGYDIATVCACGPEADARLRVQYHDQKPPFTILRPASHDDLDHFNRNRNDELNVLEKSRELVEYYELDMKVTEAEWQLDRQRLTIFFTAPQRIDFRELVKELARSFKTRIELRQISTREEAKRIGGVGPCGRSVCCSSFNGEFSHVTLEHARNQQLSNNVSKLSGYCGRLKCCLLYEHENYIEEYKNYPAINSTVEMPDGNYILTKIDIFKHAVTLYSRERSMFGHLTCEEVNNLALAGKVHKPEIIEEHTFDCDIEELHLLEATF